MDAKREKRKTDSAKSYDFVLRYSTTSTVYGLTQPSNSSITLRFSFVSSSDRVVISLFLRHRYVLSVNLTVNSYARHSYVERIYVDTNETREARSRIKVAFLSSSSISLNFSSPVYRSLTKNIFFWATVRLHLERVIEEERWRKNCWFGAVHWK